MTSKDIVRCTRPTLALVGVAAVCSLGIAEPVAASSADCERGTNGFVDIRDSEIGHLVGDRYDIDLGRGVRVSLRHGSVAGAQRGWALVSGATRISDRVWMDWTRDGGSSWIQCGPFTVRRNNTTYTTPAMIIRNNNKRWRFRACGDILIKNRRQHKCTPWW